MKDEELYPSMNDLLRAEILRLRTENEVLRTQNLELRAELQSYTFRSANPSAGTHS